jgi:hypothetical protein
MNKVLIVGHPQSGYQEVERVLIACGMQAARPSRREGMSPADMGVTLCKAHNVPDISELTNEEDFRQIEAGPVWHGMALDLMLGNLEQGLWGWSDPQAIFLLNYWLNLDPTLVFVLVYDRPHRVLAGLAANDAEGLTPAVVRHRLDNWKAYNGELLRFYLRHPERCLLVSARQTGLAVETYIEQLQSRLNAPIALSPAVEPAKYQLRVDGAIEEEAGWAAPISIPQEMGGPFAQSVAELSVEDIATAEPSRASAAEDFLIDAVMADHPDCLQAYEELQSVAGMALVNDTHRPPTAADAWVAMVRQRAQIREWFNLLVEKSKTEVGQLQQQLEVLKKQLVNETAKHAQLSNMNTAALGEANAQVGQLQQQVERLKKELADEAAKHAHITNKKTAALSEENELLLAQLHQVQEELEAYYLENKKLKQKSAPPKKAPPAHYGAAERIKRQLSYRLGAVMIQRSHSLGGWLGMPWALLRERRSYHMERAQRPQKKLPPIDRYRDADEAERVKRHLSYRLGSTMIRNARSPIGWIRMPFSLWHEVTDFRKRRSGAQA